ncbi:flippase [Candidatus Gottesmanbacteria bacterium]|nr:flippase [Candidatus Gottesmanbacteria bacterium]
MLEFTNVRGKILFNTIIQFVNRFAISGSAFIVNLIIAFYFGARGYGEYAKATTFIALFYLFTDFGLNAVTLRDMTHDPKHQKGIVNNLFGLRTIASVILIIIALVIVYFLPYNETANEGFTPVAKLAIASLTILILYQAFLNTTNLIFQKNLRYEQSTIANIIASLTTVLAVYLLVIKGFSLPVVLLGYGVGGIVGAIVLYYFTKRLDPSFAFTFDKNKSINLIKRAFPLGLTLIFNLVYFRADVFVLTLTRTTTEVGTYGLAYKFFEFPLTFPTFFANAIYPILLIRSKDKKVFIKTSVKAGAFLFVMSIITMIGLYIFAPFLRYIRADFIPSIEILQLLSISTPIFFISSLFMWIMITYGKNKMLMIIYFIGMVFNIILCILYIPTYGTTGAAIITLISEALVLILSSIYSIKLLRSKF